MLLSFVPKRLLFADLTHSKKSLTSSFSQPVLSVGEEARLPGDLEDTEEAGAAQNADAERRHDARRGEYKLYDTTHHYKTVKTVE